MHFITKGFKRFSKSNSTDPRQRVPLKAGQLKADLRILKNYGNLFRGSNSYLYSKQGNCKHKNVAFIQ